jgi:hypothetical protein
MNHITQEQATSLAAQLNEDEFYEMNLCNAAIQHYIDWRNGCNSAINHYNDNSNEYPLP